MYGLKYSRKVDEARTIEVASSGWVCPMTYIRCEGCAVLLRTD